MHIPDGVISAAVAAGSYVVAGAVTYYSVNKINKAGNGQEQVPKAALLTAAFFVTSLIHIPIPPTSVHLLLSGLIGALLGYFAMPAILVGLILQAIMFGHGGLTTIGVNAIILGVPALVSYHVFELIKNRVSGSTGLSVAGFVAGGLGIGLSVLLFFGILITTIPADMLDADLERQAIMTLTLAHLPLILVEGGATAMLVNYLSKVKPKLLQGLSNARA